MCAICTRLESQPDGTRKAYIMTLGTLPAYRGRGLGSQCIQTVLEECVKMKENPPTEIYLHVQTSNQQALDFYAHFGFVKGEVIKNYYKK